MFENLEENKNNQSAAPEQPVATPQFPPQAKVEDIFSGVKEAGTPLNKNGKAAPEPIKVANRANGGGGMVMKLLVVVIVVLILAIAGLVVASQYFGFTGLKDLVSGNSETVIPQENTNIVVPPSSQPSEPVTQDPAAIPEPVDNGSPSGMPGSVDSDAIPSGQPSTGLPEDVNPPTVVDSGSESAGTSTSAVPAIDSDNDGISDADEVVLGTDPAKADTDGDGLLDGEEVNTYKTSPLKVDTDNDELSDYEEVKKYLTDPNNPDTDADTYLDGKEVKGGYNPKGPGQLIIGN
jgi:hypothetical protein